ncbi:MAG: hypothetical protein GY783_03390 [Gammaproteobacteria bacterium]|nr:hypothetical protein [Gammaproteobacteria bacterium]
MGFLSVMKSIGKGIAKGVGVAGDVASHPAMTVLQVAFPVAWLAKGLSVVRVVHKAAKETEELLGAPMTDEEKREAFAAEFRAEFPEASNGDIATLASVLTKLEKSGAADGDDE